MFAKFRPLSIPPGILHMISSNHQETKQSEFDWPSEFGQFIKFTAPILFIVRKQKKSYGISSKAVRFFCWAQLTQFPSHLLSASWNHYFSSAFCDVDKKRNRKPDPCIKSATSMGNSHVSHALKVELHPLCIKINIPTSPWSQALSSSQPKVLLCGYSFVLPCWIASLRMQGVLPGTLQRWYFCACVSLWFKVEA